MTAQLGHTIEPTGSITDVDGVLVGHHHRIAKGWQTGTTAVVIPGGATPGVDVRGGGPGTRETDALAPTNLIDTIHAVCLTGGSAFGLAAADGVMAWLEERGLGFPIPSTGSGAPGVVPVVPAAVIFDLARRGRFASRPDPSFGSRAATDARAAQARWGSVGAGAGAVAGALQGGVGTASTSVRPAGIPTGSPYAIGAVAVVNAAGSPVDRRTGLPWEPAGFDLRRPSTTDRTALRSVLDGPVVAPLNTTIGVVATSARLTKAEATKLASVAHDGLARALRPAHSLLDGDTIFALATGAHDLPETSAETGGREHVMALHALFEAGADVFAAACTHALLSASDIGPAPAFRSLCPSAFRANAAGRRAPA